jgi:hypothetical protein
VSYLSPLEGLLASCTARVVFDGAVQGTAYFVAPGRAISAAHVVKGLAGLHVDLETEDGRTFGATVLSAWPESRGDRQIWPPPDLALLAVGSDDHPCAQLTRQTPVDGAELKVRGFTRSMNLGRVVAETGLTRYDGQITPPGEDHPIYKMAHGQVVDGMSGGPVLDMAAGLVVGMVRTSRSVNTDLGGWVVPSRQILALMPEVADAHDEFHRRDTRWAAARKAAADGEADAESEPPWWAGTRIRPFRYRSGRRERYQYLLDETLPYIRYDGEDGDLAPDELLARLELPGAGVLLVAPPGAGKTRLCWEVGRRAVRTGWLVWCTRSPSLDPSGTTSALTFDDLRRAIRNEGGPRPRQVLIMLDYLENHDVHLHFDQLEELLDDLEERTHVALLATCRPGAELRLMERAAVGLLEPRHLPDSRNHRTRLVDSIVEKVAPTALARWGRAEVRNRCGARHATPMITLLLAVAWEKAAIRAADGLNTRDAADLASWLISRLRLDRFVPGRAAGPEPVSADDLVCYALAAATCRTTSARVRATVRAAAPVQADQVNHVGRLEEAGWLIVVGEGTGEDREYDVLHDSVTDTLLMAVLFPSGNDEVSMSCAVLMLDAAATDPGTLNRFCTNIARLHSDLRDGARPRRAVALGEACAAWVADNPVLLRKLVGADGADQLDVLLTLLHHEPWASALSTSLDKIVGSTPSAPVIAELLRSVPGERPVAHALIWLSRNPVEPETARVLVHLARREELLNPEYAKQTAAYAARWLAQNPRSTTTDQVLRALLTSRPMLATDEVDRFADAAGDLLRNATADRAIGLLVTLLGHAKLVRAATADLVDRAITAVDVPDNHVSAGPLLGMLLTTDLEPDQLDRTFSLADRWLVDHLTASSAPYLLRGLLGHGGLLGHEQHRLRAVEFAMTWLARRLSDPEAVVVMLALLRHGRLAPAQVRRLAQQCLRWADLPPQLGQDGSRNWSKTGVVVIAETMRIIQIDADYAPSAAQRVYRRLPSRNHDALQKQDAQVLHALLVGRRPKNLSKQLRMTAMAWLRRFVTTLDASWVLQGLLQSGGATAEVIGTVMWDVIIWLQRHGGSVQASWVISAGLAQQEVSAENARILAEHAQSWLATAEDPNAAKAVVRAMVARGAIEAVAVEGVATQLFPGDDQWVQRLGFVEDVLPSRKGTWRGEFTAATVLRYLGRAPTVASAPYTIFGLLRRPLRLQQVEQLTGYAVEWLGVHEERGPAAQLLIALLLLGKDHRNTVPSRAIVAPALAWVESCPTAQRFGGVVSCLLARADISDEQRAYLRLRAAGWLAENPTHRDTGTIIVALLREGPLMPADPDEIVRVAMHWLAEYPEHDAVSVVVQELWQSGRLDQRGLLATLAVLLDWLDAQDVDSRVHIHVFAAHLRAFYRTTVLPEDSNRLLRHLLACVEHFDLHDAHGNRKPGVPAGQHMHRKLPDVLLSGLKLWVVDPDLSQRLLERALSWVDRPDLAAHTPQVLHHLLRHPHITADQALVATDRALQWLRDHGLAPYASLLTQSLLDIRHLSPDQLDFVAGVALSLLEKQISAKSAPYLYHQLTNRAHVPAGVVLQAFRQVERRLRDAPDGKHVGQMLQATLASDVLPPDEVERTIRRALAWVARTPAHETGRAVQSLLLRPELPTAEAELLVDRTVERLRGKEPERNDGFTLTALAKRVDVSPPCRRAALDEALRWVWAHPREASMPYVAAPALAHPEATAAERARIVARLLDWLPEFPFRGSTPTALRALVHHRPGPEQWEQVLSYGQAWITARASVFDVMPVVGDDVARDLADVLLTAPAMPDGVRRTLHALRDRFGDADASATTR